MKIITAREAFNNGLTRYFTGKECSQGHLAERMISNGSCVSCLNEKRKRSREDIYEATKVWRLKNPSSRNKEAKLYREKYPEKIANRQKKWRDKNIEEVRKKDRENARRMRALNPEKQKERSKRFYEKKEKQRLKIAGIPKPNDCPICKRNEYRIVFDHCHKSGNFRGWICDQCNKVLGLVKDSPIILKGMIKYLEVFHEQTNNRTA